jgi:hypothetical protein
MMLCEALNPLFIKTLGRMKQDVYWTLCDYVKSSIYLQSVLSFFVSCSVSILFVTYNFLICIIIYYMHIIMMIICCINYKH